MTARRYDLLEDVERQNIIRSESSIYIVIACVCYIILFMTSLIITILIGFGLLYGIGVLCDIVGNSNSCNNVLRCLLSGIGTIGLIGGIIVVCGFIGFIVVVSTIIGFTRVIRFISTSN